MRSMWDHLGLLVLAVLSVVEVVPQFTLAKKIQGIYRKSKPTFRPLPPTAADMQQGLSAAKVFFEQIETWCNRFNYFPEFQNYFILYFKKYAS